MTYLRWTGFSMLLSFGLPCVHLFWRLVRIPWPVTALDSLTSGSNGSDLDLGGSLSFSSASTRLTWKKKKKKSGQPWWKSLRSPKRSLKICIKILHVFLRPWEGFLNDLHFLSWNIFKDLAQSCKDCWCYATFLQLPTKWL